MRILFVMHYPGYLRYYDSTIRGLAERGHTVYLTFNSPHKQSEGLEALSDAGERVTVMGAVPRRGDLWDGVALRVRGTVDYARYLDPCFSDARYLRARMEKVLPESLGRLAKVRGLPRIWVRFIVRVLMLLEKAIPSSRTIEEFIRAHEPDVILVTPLVNDCSPQVDVIKSAKALGIRTGLCVASWDHLTTKGLIRVEPDIVIVWNEAQKREAVDLHGISPDKIVVTGAQPFDRWFGRQPTTERSVFCHKVGLPSEGPFVLFVGSTASISAPGAEVAFVRRWIESLRTSEDQSLRRVGVLVRPHPYNPGMWGSVDITDLGPVAVWPRNGANPVNEEDRADYFDSLYHSAAVVGVNTSAMIEAAIVGRPVHAILAPEFNDTQIGTLHFRYLLSENGGFLRVAVNLPDHLSQLSESLANTGKVQEQITRFVETFVRPNGLKTPCTPIVVDAVEALGRRAAVPERTPMWLYPIQFLLWRLGLRIDRTSKAEKRRIRAGKKLRKKGSKAEQAEGHSIG